MLPYSIILIFSLIFFYSIRHSPNDEQFINKEIKHYLGLYLLFLDIATLVQDIGPIVDVGLEEHQAEVQEDVVETGVDREHHQIPG